MRFIPLVPHKCVLPLRWREKKLKLTCFGDNHTEKRVNSEFTIAEKLPLQKFGMDTNLTNPSSRNNDDEEIAVNVKYTARFYSPLLLLFVFYSIISWDFSVLRYQFYIFFTNISSLLLKCIYNFYKMCKILSWHYHMYLFSSLFSTIKCITLYDTDNYCMLDCPLSGLFVCKMLIEIIMVLFLYCRNITVIVTVVVKNFKRRRTKMFMLNLAPFQFRYKSYRNRHIDIWGAES